MPPRKKKTVKKTRKKSRKKNNAMNVWPWICVALIFVFCFLHLDDIKAYLSPVESPGAVSEYKPKMVFVIDDIGYHRDHESKLLKLEDKVVYAILPMLPFSKHFSTLGHKSGADVILHLPLETVDGTIPGRGLITRQMENDYILDVLNRNLSSVPHHIGANNHMGSMGTSDPELMRVILRDMKKRGLFFLDSVTTSQTVVEKVASETGTPFLKRDIFLDNIDAKQAILNQIKKQKSIARKQGYAIGIGHYRDATLSVLIDIIPELEQEGFEVISLSALQKQLK